MKRLALLLSLLALAAVPARAEDPTVATNDVPRRWLVEKRQRYEGFQYLPTPSSISVSRCFEPADGEAENEDICSPIVPILAVGIFPPAQIGSEDASVLGVRLSLPYAKHAGVIGIDAGVVNDVGYLAGVQFGIVNLAEEFHGFQFGVFNRSEYVLGGAQIGLVNWTDYGVDGVQAGLFNMCADLCGVQIGLFNSASAFEGVQIGLINDSGGFEGLQLGGLNIETSANLVLPILNISF